MKADSAATCNVLDHNISPEITIPHEPVIITLASKHQQRSVATKLLPLHPKISMNAKKAPTFATDLCWCFDAKVMITGSILS